MIKDSFSFHVEELLKRNLLNSSNLGMAFTNIPIDENTDIITNEPYFPTLFAFTVSHFFTFKNQIARVREGINVFF
jgi:hypothetical protein